MSDTQHVGMPVEDDASTLHSVSSRHSSITVLSDAASVFSFTGQRRSSNNPAAARRPSSQLSNRLRRLSSANSTTNFLFDIVERGDLAALQKYADGPNKADVIHYLGKDEATLLHAAAACNHVAIVLYLLSRGISTSMRTKRQDREPLYIAAQHNSLESAAILIDRGRATVSARSKYDGATALHKAAIEGHEDMIRLLLTAGADVDVEDIEGLRPLNWAVQAARLPVVKLLLDNGSSSKMRTNKGFTALQRAVTAGDSQIVKILAEQGGYAAVNADAPFGIRALHQAAYDNKTTILQILVNAGAFIDARTHKGWTALHCAARYGYSEACRILIENGADEQAVTVKMKTPKQLAEKWKQPYCVQES